MGAFAEQRAARVTFAADALGNQPTDEEVQRAVADLEAGMGRLWRVPWENRHKEVLWRLSVNGVPWAGGHNINLAGPCPCGWEGPGTGTGSDVRGARAWRAHYFWDCPVAVAVVQQLRMALPGKEVNRHNVWLLRPPVGIDTGVWGVVCAAALEAMSRGRRVMWGLHNGDPHLQLPQGQTLITQYFAGVGAAQPPSPTPTVRAGLIAAAHFWAALQDFAALKEVPDAWAELSSDHPFLALHWPEGRKPRIVVRMPQAQAA